MIITTKGDKFEIVSFTVGRINALIADEIRDTIIKLINESNSNLIIDLKGVEYIDSSGFGCFLSIMRAAKNNYGIVKFTNPEPGVMEVFRTLRLDTVFQIFDDIESCMNSFATK